MDEKKRIGWDARYGDAVLISCHFLAMGISSLRWIKLVACYIAVLSTMLPSQDLQHLTKSLPDHVMWHARITKTPTRFSSLLSCFLAVIACFVRFTDTNWHMRCSGSKANASKYCDALHQSTLVPACMHPKYAQFSHLSQARSLDAQLVNYHDFRVLGYLDEKRRQDGERKRHKLR